MQLRFVSTDRATDLNAEFDEPDRYRDLAQAIRNNPVIPRGSGLSYVAASFGEGVQSIGMRRFNRLLEFDADRRLVNVEAGITVGELQGFLAGHELTLPVQPGYPDITIGGCLACNIHGKNQFLEGLFGDWVEELSVLRPEGIISVSRQINPELFELTIGGFGLTGIIVSAKLKLKEFQGRSVRQSILPVHDLIETTEKMEELKSSHDLLYSWNDLSRPRTGRSSGFIIAGRFEPGLQATPWRGASPLNPSARKLRPAVLVPASSAWVNRLYRRLLARQDGSCLSLFDFLYPVARRVFYFDVYGEGGFLEHQVLVPREAWSDYVRGLAGLQARFSQPIPLVSVKLFRGEQRLLHYNGTGYSLSLDLFSTPATLEMLAALDDLDCDLGCRANLAKDSRLPAKVAQRQYSQYDLFREALLRWDPLRRYQSHLSRRLGL